MIKYTIMLGLNDSVTRKNHPRARAVAAICKQFADLGATLTDHTGIYTYADGSAVVEPSIEITVYGEESDGARIEAGALALKAQFNQECVILNSEEAPATKFLSCNDLAAAV